VIITPTLLSAFHRERRVAAGTAVAAVLAASRPAGKPRRAGRHGRPRGHPRPPRAGNVLVRLGRRLLRNLRLYRR